ncbi:branched-chain amino acid aminotransferase [Jeotgalicoccus sp. FSL K6-3177]|uniref:branched-chain amino acid aminotransferase n=1 Tax=Jeotgalicoccus sp. FSL K6-3177 TaxID=2921494 RepID=UPI0030FD84AD
MTQQLQITKARTLKEKPEVAGIPFGSYFTDHMFSMDYSAELGWHDASIVPYAPFEISPSAQALHYGQTVFEGLKAYNVDGEVTLFRPDENFKRLNRSLERMSMPKVDGEFALRALTELLKLEHDWVPDGEGQALYVRPIVFADEPYLGIRPAKNYKMLIVLSPVAGYYGAQLNPTSIFVEDNYVRAVRGGVGEAKFAGNYAASLTAQQKANDLGYEQVLWLDGVHQEYVEEVGSMNIFFVRNGELVTPELNGSILPGITRKSLITLADDLGLNLVEERLHIDDVEAGIKDGSITEVFGAGTAAVIAPVGIMNIHGTDYRINGNEIGEVTQKLYDHLTGIQTGKLEDKHGWVYQVTSMVK